MISSPPPGDDRRELHGWKQIADLLGISVRAAQKWEEERRLPVHRVPGKRGLVSARVEELDAWRNAAGRDLVSHAGWRIPWRLTAAALLCVLVLGGGAAAWMVWGRTGEPNGLRIEHNDLVVLDGHGREIWRRNFEKGFAYPDSYAKPTDTGPHWKITDLDGDGHNEVLFSYSPRSLTTDGSIVYCFSRTGVEKWRFVPGRNVATARGPFTPVYRTVGIAVVRTGKGQRPVVAVTSAHHIWWPDQVAILSGTGQLLREYWHPGVLFRIEAVDLDGDGIDEILLGGVNNARGMATLVVLDPNQADGAAAEPDTPDFQFAGLAQGRERVRILFPRSCISRALEKPWNRIWTLVPSKDSLTLSTHEGDDGGEANVYYHLDKSYRLDQVGVSDGYPQIHAELRKSGRVDHAYREQETVDLRNGVQVVRAAGAR